MQRNLSLKGKILIAKSLIISRIWYTAYLLPPNRKQITEINRLITLWIKGTSRMLPRYSVFQLSLDHQGLEAPIIRDMLDTRLLTVWIKLLTGNFLWSKFERERIENILKEKRNILVLQALKQTPIKSAAWPTEWKPYIHAWRRVEEMVKASTEWP